MFKFKNFRTLQFQNSKKKLIAKFHNLKMLENLDFCIFEDRTIHLKHAFLEISTSLDNRQSILLKQ